MTLSIQSSVHDPLTTISKKVFLRFSQNSKANASELQDIPEEKFPLYYIHSSEYNSILV